MDEKYYTYVEPGDDGVTPVYRTLSETEIINSYWDYWREQMIKVRCKGDSKKFDSIWSPEDCIGDWVVVHWAWETDKDVKE